MAKTASPDRPTQHKARAAEVPANVLEVTSQAFKRPPTPTKVPVSELRMPYYSEETLYELIKTSGLWNDKFLYSGINPNDRRFIQQHGTYRKTDDNKPRATIFCCELGEGSEIGKIVQVDRGGFSLWDYATQNGDNRRLAVIVWRKDTLEQRCGAEFGFKDPDDRKNSIERLLIIQITDRRFR